MNKWSEWLKDWRAIANQSHENEPTSITITWGDARFEVLRVSKFYNKFDTKMAAYVKTPIREFNNRTALHSRATRDLGIVRVITNKHKPMFLIEPGGDVLDWMASTQDIQVKELVKVMRMGDLGRRVRRRDRKALKDSEARNLAVQEELNKEIDDLRLRERELMELLEDAKNDRDRMRDNLITQNGEQSKSGMILSDSGTESSPLGTRKNSGYKSTSNKPLPGSYGG